MSVEQNRALVRRFWGSSTEPKSKLLDELLASNFVRYAPDGKTDKAGFKQGIVGLEKAFANTRFTIESMVAEGDRIAFWYTWTGTDKGGYAGNPATGKRVTMTQANFCRFDRGKVVELRVFPAGPTLYEQLDITPPGAKPAKAEK